MGDIDDELIDGEALEVSFHEWMQSCVLDDETIRDIYEAGWVHAHKHISRVMLDSMP